MSNPVDRDALRGLAEWGEQCDFHLGTIARWADNTIAHLLAAIDAGADDGTLDCVAKDQTHADGSPAQECPEFISRPEAMCAGCRIRVVAKAARLTPPEET